MHKANLKGMNPVRAGRSVFARREEESAQKTQYQILVSFTGLFSENRPKNKISFASLFRVGFSIANHP
jgi:hypothetical protein